ncbi:helix-turn-helix transcriptional regulator [Streptomyces olivoreticuli]|uniref:helix-turn-helix domain-containing protein n=1 Tax=Streptomyces olivoreticuli TaxID=68246 RepID=UPI00265AC2D4|nr:helix-turn-helix transcriptional regulator [Streptomyces olivoreticuli]WKK27145.1 helix-turn-helix transcriptional regulator [Streptomyces olivoreticuli]
MLMRGIANPPVSWRYCGDQLKSWRAIAGVSREDLARESNYGVETIKSMEQGRRKPSRRVLEVADQMCGAQGLLLAACPYLQPEPVTPQAPGFLAAEAAAVALHNFELLLIPGLLQTEEYARALMMSNMPPIAEEAVESGVAHRMQRQKRLDEPTTLFNFVIFEAALRTMLGGPEAMKRQLRHMLEAGKRRNVFIQILPAGQGYFPGMTGAFTMVEDPEGDHLVFTECQGTSQLDCDSERVNKMAKRYAMLRMQALSEEASRKFISELLE